MYAVIESGGQQHQVTPGRYVTIRRLAVEQDGPVVFDRVLLVRPDSGDVAIGRPVVEGAEVRGVVRRHLRGKKIHGFKYKAKKGYSRRWGARAELTQVTIEAIVFGGQTFTAADVAEAAPLPSMAEAVAAAAPAELEDELAAEPLEAIDEFEDELDDDRE